MPLSIENTIPVHLALAERRASYETEKGCSCVPKGRTFLDLVKYLFFLECTMSIIRHLYRIEQPGGANCRNPDDRLRDVSHTS